jgi:hypothetical protein
MLRCTLLVSWFLHKYSQFILQFFMLFFQFLLLLPVHEIRLTSDHIVLLINKIKPVDH